MLTASLDGSSDLGLELVDDNDQKAVRVSGSTTILRVGDLILSVDGEKVDHHATAIQLLDEPGVHNVRFVRRPNPSYSGVFGGGFALGILVGIVFMLSITLSSRRAPPQPSPHGSWSKPCNCFKPDAFFNSGSDAAYEANYKDLFALGRKKLGYELPLPNFSAPVEHRHWFTDLPQGFSYRVPAQERLWRSFIDARCVRPEHRNLLKDTGMYPDLDRTFFFCMLRRLQPRRLVEIGAGQSTVVARAALANNSVACEHTVIEPYRAHEVPAGVRVLQHELQNIPNLSAFEALRADDVLFIDSSHVVMPYGDTLVEMLALLPRLRAGVYVHFHDIFLPFDYPEPWTKRQNLVYTEQWALALMLAGADADWEVVWSSWLMRETRQEVLLAMPNYPLSHPTGPNGASFWIRKLKGPRRGHGHRRNAVWDKLYAAPALRRSFAAKPKERAAAGASSNRSRDPRVRPARRGGG